MPRTPTLSPELLNAALEGMESQRQRIEIQIAEVRRLLGTRRPGRPRATAASDTPGGKPAKRRKMSAATIAHIREAQKKRWAEFHKAQGEKADGKPARKKRRMSDAGRKAIGDAARRRWAAFHKQNSQAAAAAQKPARKKAAAKTGARKATAKRTAKASVKAAKNSAPAPVVEAPAREQAMAAAASE